MKKIKNFTIIAIFGILFAACNNEIFVEPLPDIPEEIDLDGFKGVEIVTIPQKGLRNVTIGDNYGMNWQPFTCYYDKEGNELYNPSKISDVSKILYACKMFAVEFNIRGDEVEIVALDNAYTDPVRVWVNLDYGYAEKHLGINIGVGRPLEIKRLNHSIDGYVVETETLRVNKGNVHNNTDRPIRVSVFPYTEALSKLILSPGKDENWSNRATGIVPVPLYYGGEWSQYDTEDVDATIGNITTFISQNVNENEEGYIEVPANSSVSATLYVTYSKLKTGYSAVVGFPNIDIDWIADGTLEVIQPIDYKLEISVVDL